MWLGLLLLPGCIAPGGGPAMDSEAAAGSCRELPSVADQVVVHVLPPSDEKAVSVDVASRLNETVVSFYEKRANGTTAYRTGFADAQGCAAAAVRPGSDVSVFAHFTQGERYLTTWDGEARANDVRGVHRVEIPLGRPLESHVDCLSSSFFDISVSPQNVTPPADVVLDFRRYDYSYCSERFNTTAWTVWLGPDSGRDDGTWIWDYTETHVLVARGDSVPGTVNITIAAPGKWHLVVAAETGNQHDDLGLIAHDLPGTGPHATLFASNITLFEDGAENGPEQWDVATTLLEDLEVPVLVGDFGWKITEDQAQGGSRSWWADTAPGMTTSMTSKDIHVPNDGFAHFLRFSWLVGEGAGGDLQFQVTSGGSAYWSETLEAVETDTWQVAWRDLTALAGTDIRLEFSHTLPACGPLSACGPALAYVDDLRLT